MLTRRAFIKVLGAANAVILNPMKRLGWWRSPEFTLAEEAEGELYAGFVLLPEGATIPPFIQDEKVGIPNMCGAGEAETRGCMNAEYVLFEGEAELAVRGGFPVYTLNQPPDELRPSGAFLLKNKNGSSFSGTVAFEAYDDQLSSTSVP